jgi:uncharacterized protein
MLRNTSNRASGPGYEKSVLTVQFNVAQLLKAPSGSSRKYDILADVSLIDEDIRTVGPLSGSVELRRTSDGILATGQLQIKVEMTCCRCLEPFSLTVDFYLEEEFYPSVDIFSGGQINREDAESPEEDEATIIDEHHILDLSEVVRQNIVLAAPMHPVCRPDCAGLCSQCGHNLNEDPCGCHEEVIDPRWAALKKLKEY